jgi:hypothetical protein
MGGNLRMLGSALATCVAVWAWTLANIVPLFLLLKKFGLLRSSPEQEEAGLDVALHGGFAYDQENKDDDEKGIAFVALAKAYASTYLPLSFLPFYSFALSPTLASCCFFKPSFGRKMVMNKACVRHRNRGEIPMLRE